MKKTQRARITSQYIWYTPI